MSICQSFCFSVSKFLTPKHEVLWWTHDILEVLGFRIKIANLKFSFLVSVAGIKALYYGCPLLICV